MSSSNDSYWSYTRPALTVLPYAIANRLPFQLVSSFDIFASDSPQRASEYFFRGGSFSSQSVLVGWEHEHIPTTVNALIGSYFLQNPGSAPVAPDWPAIDYDTIWTVTLDSHGNLTVDNGKCEGINSAELPATAPRF